MNDSYATLLPQNVQSIARKGSPSRKRKRDEDEESGFWTRRIDIPSEDGSPSTDQSLEPLRVITRAQLPLSFLDPSTLICKRFRIDTQFPRQRSDRQSLLVAKSADEELYVIEKIQDTLYAVCRLATHVTLQTIDSLRNEPPKSLSRTPDHARGDWRAAAAVKHPPKEVSSRSRKAPRLSMMPVDPEKSSQTLATSVQMPPILSATHKSAAEKLLDVQHESTPEEAFATFIRQYLEILYKSRASVAYFAKAHVSRLKASLGSDAEDGKQKYREFLEGLVLSSTTADKKHKKTWPEKLQELGPTIPLETEQQSSKPVKRRKTKHKLDKQGMMLAEEESFTHWWFHGDETQSPNEAHQIRLKRRSLQLRTREAFLQIIILLEVLSLGSSAKPSVPSSDASSSSKPKDYNLALELLLDKLCIWHSLEHGGALGAATEGETEAENKAPDQLREFCVEVIVPFYTARAPELASVVNKKLGGPVAVSPAARRRTNPFDQQKPKRSVSDGVHRATDKSKQPETKVAKLTRHISDSQRVKRESSEVSFDSIPLATTNKANANMRRSNALDKMKMKQREVDFDALSQAQEQRRKKQAETESKLKDAIQALKRPNRALAGKELAEVVEQRERMAQARDRAAKAQKARQKPAIQVDATPKRSRTRTDIIVTPEAHRRTEPNTIASTSTVSRIPSSGVREQPVEFSVPHTGHRERQQAVEATPVRAISFALPAIPQSATKPAVFETPVKIGKLVIAETPEAKALGVEETPRASNNIYDALGWNE